MSAFKFLLAVAIWVANIGFSHGQTVISYDNMELNPSLTNNDRYELKIYQDAQREDPTSVFFNVELSSSSVDFVLDSINVDEGADWFHVVQNQEFSRESIANGDHDFWAGFGSDSGTLSFPLPTGVPPQISGETQIYLGVATGQGFDGDSPNRDVYGWANISILGNNFGDEPVTEVVLQLNQNVIAYGAQGIEVGTRRAIAVPEPSAFSLTAILFAVCSLVRRRNISDCS